MISCGQGWEPSGPAAVRVEVAIFFLPPRPYPPRITLHLYPHPFPPSLPHTSAPISEYLLVGPPAFLPSHLPPLDLHQPAPAGPILPGNSRRSSLSLPALPGLAPLHPRLFALGLPGSLFLPPPWSPLSRPGPPACRCPSRVPSRTFAAGAVRTVFVDPGLAPGAVMAARSVGGMGILRGEEGQVPRPRPQWSPDPQRPLGPSERAPAEALA